MLNTNSNTWYGHPDMKLNQVKPIYITEIRAGEK